MTENLYTQYANKYYNPNDDGKKPGDNENWESIQKGFSRIGSTQLETSEGLTLGKGTEDETSVTAAELEEIKNPTELETSGGLTLGKGTADEVSVTAAELTAMKNGGGNSILYRQDAVEGESNKFVYEDIDIETVKTNVNNYYTILHFTGKDDPDSSIYEPLLSVTIYDTPQVSNARVYISGVTYSPAPEITADVNIIGMIGNWYITDDGHIAEIANF